jgi:hypothetical protein
MTRSPVVFLVLLFGILGAAALTGCGGTETGNPSGPQPNSALVLVQEICGVLTTCFGSEDGFTEDDCEGALSDSDTLGAAFGVEEEPAPAYAEVIERVDNSDLLADEEALDGCVDAIRSLTCDDPGVQAVDIEGGFLNVEDMIPEASCSEVFSGS